jgi:subtilisin-like proprotein convertase family protein
MRVSVFGRAVASVIALGALSLPGLTQAQAADGPFLRSIPEGYIAPGPLHRVLFPAEAAGLQTLLERGAVLSSEDYGSFVWAWVDANRVGGVEGLRALGAELRDEDTLINFNGYVLDGARPATSDALLATIPAHLRAPQSAPADGESRLRVVQFAGPVKDAWSDMLRATGAHIVSYVANNAYVVKTDPHSDARVQGLRSEPAVLSIRSYEPAFKLRPELRGTDFQDSWAYTVIVQVIADREGEAFARSLGNFAIASLGEPEAVIGYWNVKLEIDGANLHELALDPRIFAIEPVLEARLFDEAQGQIMAGNLNAAGTQPSGPGYLAWLTSKGFPGTSPFPFSVDVVDDGVDRGSTTDVNVEFRVNGTAAGASRVTFNNNYSGDALADGGGGHGNINASIIGGYNNLTGAAAEDASGYNYGLGIAPWVGIGNTKVFSNSGAGVFNQPTLTRLAAAYNSGARISSNSWGYTSGTTYNTDSQAHDQAVRDALSGTAGNQEFAIVFAAGNDGSLASTVHPPGTAKNIITVGAAENYRMTGSDGCGIANTGADNAMDVISFSSRGPTSDSRKKPEIMAPGTHIQGAASRSTVYNGSGVCNQYWPTGQTLYCWSSGTSHSTPAIAGAAALVRQWHANNSLPTPSPAMTKATLVASATHMTGVGANDTLWSNNQGMGNVNLGRVFDTAARIRVDQTQVIGATGGTYTVSGSIASSTTPFRVALAWTDAFGPTTGNAYVNNLDLEVTVNGTLYRGNVFSGANSVAGGTADVRNNLESVFLPAGTSGSFSITVRGTNIAGDGVPGNADTTDQDFALLVYNGSASAPSPDFSLAASPASATVIQGSSTNFTISSTALNGFSGTISLSASPAISGVSYSFAPASVAGGSNSVLTVSTTAAATIGTQTLTITGTSGALVRTTNVSLTINAPAGANPVKTFSASPGLSIPDNNTTGVNSTIAVPDSLTIASVSVEVTITHPNKSQLIATLTAPDGTTRILHNRTGGNVANVITTYAIVTTPNQPLTALNGKNTLGNWRLNVSDRAAGTVGTFNSWKITFNGEQTASPSLAIPDNNTTGVTSTINYTRTGTVASVKVRTTIPHTYKGDLEVALIGPDGTTVLLHNRTGGATDNVTTEFPDLTVPAQSLSAFTGKTITGNWSLRVRDLAAGDTGTLSNWTLSLTAQ